MATDVTLHGAHLVRPLQVRLFLRGHELVILPRPRAFSFADKPFVEGIGHPDGDLPILVPEQGVVALFTPVLISVVGHEKVFRIFAECRQFQPAQLSSAVLEEPWPAAETATIAIKRKKIIKRFIAFKH